MPKHVTMVALDGLKVVAGIVLPVLLLVVALSSSGPTAVDDTSGSVSINSDLASLIASGTYTYLLPGGGLATTTYVGPQNYYKVLEYDGRQELAQAAFAGDTYSVFYLDQHIVKGVGDASADLVPEFRILDEVFLRALHSGAAEEAGLALTVEPPPSDYPSDALPVPSTLVVGEGEQVETWQLLDYDARITPSPAEQIAALVAEDYRVTIDA